MLINSKEKLEKFKAVVEKCEKDSRRLDMFLGIINHIESISLEHNYEIEYSSPSKDPNLIVTNLRFRQNQKEYLLVTCFGARGSAKYFLQVWALQPAKRLKGEEIIKMFPDLIYYIDLL